MASKRPEEITAFAQYLAGITDEAERIRAIKRAQMIAADEAPDAAFEPPIRPLGKYLSDPIEVPPVLIHPYMCVRGGLNVTVGRAGKGKTVMNLNRMLRWSAGLPMFDEWVDKDGNSILAPEQPLKILIVENEGAAGLFHRQIGIMAHQEAYLPEEARELAFENLLIWKDGGYSGLKLDEERKLKELRAGIEKWQPDMVFIEPFRSLWSGEENSSTEMNVVVDALVGIAADFNCGVWAAHHEKKGGAGEDDKMSAARGSSVLEGIVTVMENFESTKGGDQRELMWSKSRHGVAPAPVTMEWDPEAWWYKYVPSDDIDMRIVEALQLNADEPMTVAQMAEVLDEKEPKVRKAMNRMKDAAKLKTYATQSDGRGSTGVRYRLPTNESDTGGGLAL